MAKLLLYLLESSALLAFFYLAYLLVMKRETFFSLNRFFLLAILVASLLFPFVSFDFNPAKVAVVERPLEQVSRLRMSYYEAVEEWEYSGYRASTGASAAENGSSFARGFSWFQLSVALLFAVYAIGVVVCLSRTVWTIRWISKLISTYPREGYDDAYIITLPYQIAPFSFFKYVFVYDALPGTQEFDQILAHERTHIRQRHSIDLLFVQLSAAFLWFNPVIWQLIKSLKTTHEYIADKKIISSGYSLVEYQTLLLKQLISNNSFGLVHNFNLSFIKKRITMMKNQKSGWPGKVRVAMALVGAVLFSAIVVQCNSKMDEPVVAESAPAAETTADFGAGVHLPVVPDNGYTFDGNTADALNFSIADDKLSIDGEAYKVSDIASVLSQAKLSEQGIIIMRVDKDQPMKLVRDVQTELRTERRKLLYVGQTLSGKSFEMPFLLPPMPGIPMPDGQHLPTIDDEYAAEHNVDILKIQLGDNAGASNQQLVYDFVTDQMQKGKSNYVVSAKYSDDDTYGDYLVNLAYIQEGFNQIYQERSQQMFGKDFYDIAASNREQYDAVRKGVPRAISIAEK